MSTLERGPQSVGAVGAMIGTYGIEFGPKFHIVDESALTDRFLAQQEFKASNFEWRIGHFTRPVPSGYLEAIRLNRPEMVSDAEMRDTLRRLWEEIREFR
jgi:hypothetical protein